MTTGSLNMTIGQVGKMLHTKDKSHYITTFFDDKALPLFMSCFIV